MKKHIYIVLAAWITSAMMSSGSRSTIVVGGLIVDTLDEIEESREDMETAFPRLQIGDMLSTLPQTDFRSQPDPIRPAPSQNPALRHAFDGESFMRQGHWETALREFQRAMRLDRGNYAYVQRVAIAAALSGNYALADFHFRQFLEEHPDDVPSLVSRGGVLLRMTRYDDARESLNRALELEPTDIGAMYNKTFLRIIAEEDTRELSRQWEEMGVRDTIRIVQWLNADRTDMLRVMTPEQYQQSIAVMLGEGSQHHLAEIIQTFRSAISALERGDWVYYSGQLERIRIMGIRTMGIESELARSHAEMDDYRQAERIMSELAERFPGNAEIAYNHGYILMNLDSYEQALEAFTRAARLDEVHADARFGLACAYMGLDQPDAAWPILTSLAHEYPERMPEWLEGEALYLQAIRAHPDYDALKRSFQTRKAEAESQDQQAGGTPEAERDGGDETSME